jgi:hypothetical protein
MADDIETKPKHLPIDFGPWTGARWNCPRHGFQDGGLAIQVRPRRDGGDVITRRYCAVCVLAALDASCSNHEDSPADG